MRNKTKILLTILVVIFVVLAGLLYYNYSYSKRGKLGVITNPVGATVFIDDEEKGDSPLEIELDEGAYTVRVEEPGYVQHEQEAKVRRGELEVLGILLTETEE